MAFYRMPSGHFAYVINESGNRQLVTEEQFRECCCPSTCPCEGTWPPSEWPCGGVLETYSLNSILFIRDYGGYIYHARLKSPITITASSILSQTCLWSGTGQMEASIDDGATFYDSTSGTIAVYWFGGQWLINLRFSLISIFDSSGPQFTYKGVGTSPVGLYSGSNISGWTGSGSIS